MFQFPTFAFLTEWQAFYLPGCPIRKSEDQRLFASTPSLSQLITSFFASESQGIHRLPFLTFLSLTRLYVSDWYILSLLCFVSTLLFWSCPIRQRSFFLWRITDSNRWPSACKADALASWANPPFFSEFFCSPRQSWTADLYIISVAL